MAQAQSPVQVPLLLMTDQEGGLDGLAPTDTHGRIHHQAVAG